MFWNLVNQLWLNRRTLYGSLGIMFGAIIISRTQHNSPPDYSSCTNIISIQSNVPSYSDIQLYLFNSTTTDPDTSCINVLASPGDTVLLDSIPAGTEVPCENYKLPPELKCKGWDVLKEQQIRFIRGFKMQWEMLKLNTKSTDERLQNLINNNLANPVARSKVKIHSPLTVASANEDQLIALYAIQTLRAQGLSYEGIFARYENDQPKSNYTVTDRTHSLINSLEQKRTQSQGRVFVKAKAVLVAKEGTEILNDYLEGIPEDINRYAILGPG